jgi:endonuclease YncB( thermonuclease family)
LGVVLTLVLVGGIALVDAILAPRPLPLVGHAEAVDGDTLRLGRTRIRLAGLDAPELRQTCTDASGGSWPCGAAARDFVVDQLRSGDVFCAPSGRDIYRRTLAACTIAGIDLGHAIVDAGWAVGDLDYSVQQLSARGAARGIWSGNFVAPADWRRTHGTDTFDFWTWLTGLLGR